MLKCILIIWLALVIPAAADPIPDGFVAEKSSHSRGSTVDLTIVPVPDQPAPAQNAHGKARISIL